MRTLLIANRGEIAIRIARAASELGIATVAVHPADDAESLHVRRADGAVLLPGRGVKAYLDIPRLVEAARAAGCDAVHPGYGFLSENAAFARALAAARIRFVGPDPDTLDAFGHKGRARALAANLGIPVLRGTRDATTVDEIAAFLDSLGPQGAVVIKAIAGGGGRGMRVVRTAADVDAAFAACAAEAQAAFGNGALYVEEYWPRARHLEVQIAGDGSGHVSHLWERECSLQRRHQKLVEMAPSPTLAPFVRDTLLASAVELAQAVRYRGLGTIEFLVGEDGSFAFLEANPRLQVEHTVTEAITGLDLVQAQLRLASGASLDAVGLAQADVPPPHGVAVQVRVNLETLGADGDVRPSSATLTAYEPPSGPGIRVDGCGYAGYAPHPQFDSLLAKLIVHAPDAASAVRKVLRALSEFRIEGPATNIGFLQNLLSLPEVQRNEIHTGLVAERLPELLAESNHPRLYFVARTKSGAGGLPEPATPDFVRATQDTKTEKDAPAGSVGLNARLTGSVARLAVAAGDTVRPGQTVLVLEALKMEHLIAADTSGIVRRIDVREGDVVREGQALLYVEPGDGAATAAHAATEHDPDHIRPDLAEALDRLAQVEDAARPDAVARRRKRGQRTARENVADLCDPGSFQEYGVLALAAQRHRSTVDELIRISPADGFVCGTATINAGAVGVERARAAVMAYDFTVFAGTQGLANHAKLDRLLEIAAKWRLPVVLFGEGGGGRPNDFSDEHGVGGLDTTSFRNFAALSGLVPTIAIVSGRCFAGNAALVGACDVIVATENTNLGMGGPAMIEGGGLGRFAPEEVGPIDVQWANGVVDVRVPDEAAAVAAAKQYLGYFQGPTAGWSAGDPRELRHLVPENRRQVYDVRAVIRALADTGSVLELRGGFGTGVVTALVRVEGRPLGLVANNPLHLGGAIDAPASDKMARFLQLCDAFDLPVLSLCDTPGFMVGPESEKTAMVRHTARLFAIGASLDVPFLTIVLRKGYGLGAQAMTAGHFHAPLFTVAWPTGEFGAMGLEGAVRLGFSKQLDAIADPQARELRFREMVDSLYERGKAISTASFLEIDGVIDPAESRRWIVRGLDAAPPRARTGRKRPFVDPW
ncbi:MAG TPA: carboxyl transferase domain-containing protein [Nevskiaceae bacterium]|nr:carboxyl transferase domain-containing protein [Nevskiaceae bacterium]